MSAVAVAVSRATWWMAGSLVAGLAVWSAAWTWAEVSAEAASAGLLGREYDPDNPRTWERDWSVLATARGLNPLRAEYPYLQAQAARQLRLASAGDLEGLPDPAEHFLDYYQQALALRPHWGFVWTDLALARLANDEQIEAVFDALAAARRFAPFEPFVRQAELKIGLPLWEQLDQAQREEVMATVAFLVKQDIRLVIELAVLHNWSEQLRPLLANRKHIASLDRRLKELETDAAPR